MLSPVSLSLEGWGGSQVVLVAENLPAKAGDVRDSGLTPGSGRYPWMRAWEPAPVFLSRESHGQSSLKGYRPQSHKESDMTEETERTHRHSLSSSV